MITLMLCGWLSAFPWGRSTPAVQPEWRASAGLVATLVTDRVHAPVCLAAPAGDPRLFIVEQTGRIVVYEQGALRPEPFLDLSGRIRAGGERGLLGLAFHPDFARSGWLFVNFTDPQGDTRVVRFTADPARERADPASAREVLHVRQPFANHNGGWIAFGPDRDLYVALGDGGSGGDPQGNAQNLGSMLGKLLRLDVDHGEPYAIPPDNPFRRRPGARAEIWAYGLRNPWRNAFDPVTRLLYIADVGQNLWEEIDVVPADSGGLDYGWNRLEGTHGFRAAAAPPGRTVRPAIEYGHGEGCSVTGGAVYRGSRLPALVGTYFFADYCRGWLRSFRWTQGRATELREWRVGALGAVTSFGTDAAGELYVLSGEGRVYRIDPAPRAR